jgi:hypothetical protein
VEHTTFEATPVGDATIGSPSVAPSPKVVPAYSHTRHAEAPPAVRRKDRKSSGQKVEKGDGTNGGNAFAALKGAEDEDVGSREAADVIKESSKVAKNKGKTKKQLPRTEKDDDLLNAAIADNKKIRNSQRFRLFSSTCVAVSTGATVIASAAIAAYLSLSK